MIDLLANTYIVFLFLCIVFINLFNKYYNHLAIKKRKKKKANMVYKIFNHYFIGSYQTIKTKDVSNNEQMFIIYFIRSKHL